MLNRSYYAFPLFWPPNTVTMLDTRCQRENEVCAFGYEPFKLLCMILLTVFYHLFFLNNVVAFKLAPIKWFLFFCVEESEGQAASNNLSASTGVRNRTKAVLRQYCSVKRVTIVSILWGLLFTLNSRTSKLRRWGRQWPRVWPITAERGRWAAHTEEVRGWVTQTDLFSGQYKEVMQWETTALQSL